MAIDITEARLLVREFARNAGAGATSQYTDAAIDRHLQVVADDWIRTTRATRRTDTFTITIATSVVNIAAAVALGLRSDRAMRAWIPTKGRLSIIDHGSLVDRQIASTSAALPTVIAFDTMTTAEVDPLPDATYSTAKIQWWEPFVAWTPGAGSPVFNLPDEHLRIIAAGAGAHLQINEKENKQAIARWQEYMAKRDGLALTESSAGYTSDRSMLEE